MNPTPLHPDRPFTWIFAANCSENLLRAWDAVPDPVFGKPVYRLSANGLYMGLVILESLPHNSDTMVLKMLGKTASVKVAIDDIIKLTTALFCCPLIPIPAWFPFPSVYRGFVIIIGSTIVNLLAELS
jgi:hypothetical protein